MSLDQENSIQFYSNLLTEYIKFYNERNLEGIKDCLDEDLKVFLNGSLAMQGRETIILTYPNDFKEQATVDMEFMENSETCDEFSQFVHLIKQVPPKNDQTLPPNDIHLHVRYVYGKKNNKMIRHEIDKVWSQ